jgi:hypothetical protein
MALDVFPARPNAKLCLHQTLSIRANLTADAVRIGNIGHDYICARGRTWFQVAGRCRPGTDQRVRGKKSALDFNICDSLWAIILKRERLPGTVRVDGQTSQMHHKPALIADMQNNFLRYLSCPANVQKTGERRRYNQNQKEPRLHQDGFPTRDEGWLCPRPVKRHVIAIT